MNRSLWSICARAFSQASTTRLGQFNTATRRAQQRHLLFALPETSWRRSIFTTCSVRAESTEADSGSSDESIQVNYIGKNGEKVTLYGKVGNNAMHLAQHNGVDIEGACEASLACCTCHVYVRDDYFDKLPPASEEEEDLLDMAPFLKSNSRLSRNFTGLIPC